MSSPPLRRIKTYTATSGYVYQYYFVGQREAQGDGRPAAEPATEFIFDVTRDRRAMFAFTVLLPSSALRDWASRHGRSLSGPEQYAAAKMRLLRGFDDLGTKDLRQSSRQFVIDSDLLDQLLNELGVA